MPIALPLGGSESHRQVDTARVLLDAGADPTEGSPEGDVEAIAVAYGHDGILELLAAR